MQTISASLLAAATRWGSRPVVSLDVRDERPRWKALLAGSASGQVSQVVVALSYLLRVRVNAAGLAAARVFQPELAGAEWTTWTTQHTLPLAASDVAVTVVGGYAASTNCRAFFLQADGGIASLMVSESASGFGTPVGSASLVKGGLSQAGWLAAADECAFYGAAGSELRVWRKPWSGGAWAEGSAWPLGVMGACYGIAACWDPAAARAVVLAASDGAVRAALYDPAADAWSGAIQLAPGGNAAPGVGSSCRLPSVCYAGDRVVAAWVEALDVTSLRTQAVSCEAVVYPHFGGETALDLRGGATLGRPNLAYWWSTSRVYAADEGSACYRERYTPSAGAALRVEGLEPAGYRMRCDAAGSRLAVRLPNPDGRYDQLGAAGSACEAIKPLSTLLIGRGYITDSGAQSLALAPHYLLSARLLEGEAGGWLELEAGDGRALLAAWQAGEALSWQNRAIRWLLRELCARAGLGYSDGGETALGYTLARYTLGLGSSAWEGIRGLLRLAGCAARMTAAGLTALPVAGWSQTEAAQLGANGELRQAAYITGLPGATARLVYGAGAEGWAEDAAGAMALGARVLRAYADARITSSAWAALTASADLALDRLSARCARVVLPLRPELELWDPVLLNGQAWRVTGIEERWDAAAGRFETALDLGAE